MGCFVGVLVFIIGGMTTAMHLGPITPIWWAGFATATLGIILTLVIDD